MSGALGLLAALTLAAEPASSALADLQAALSRLTATTPAAARFTVHFENVTGEGADAIRVIGDAQGEASESAGGLVIRWSRALVQKAHEEERQRAVNQDAPTPTREGLAQVQSIDLANRLDAAGSLRDELSRATLLEERDDQLDGAPARLLVLKLSPILQPRERRYLKELEAIGRVWLGPDGLPLAAEARVFGKGRIFLIITFETEVRQAWRFVHTGDRLVAVRHDDERRWGGAGERGERRSSSVLELLPAVAPAVP